MDLSAGSSSLVSVRACRLGFLFGLYSDRIRRATICPGWETGAGMARWASGERTVQFLVDRNRLESFEADDLGPG